MDKWLKRVTPPTTETPSAPMSTIRDALVGDSNPMFSSMDQGAISRESVGHQAASMTSATDSDCEYDESPDMSKHMDVERRTEKRCKYDENYITLGFTCIGTGSSIQPQCVVCTKVLSHNSMKPSLLRRHMEMNHPHLKNKPREFFERELRGLSTSKQSITALTSLKTKYQHRLYVEDDLRLKLSPIRPDIKGLCASSQAHPSH
ncbi:protein FAM200B-like [Neoarius graeffei]|uniref:protein FAM200B-like n=1 Tax=Neoarius graeffei TaxID=443677 RepID=UPI00298CB560|nr:protein FAM200B-like [Neoarius graeffei]